MKIRLLCLVFLGLVYFSASTQGQERFVAITIDDLPAQDMGPGRGAEYRRIASSLVSSVVELNIPIHGFVTGDNLSRQGDELLDIWAEAGIKLGNHSYTHFDLNNTQTEVYKQDILKGEEVISRYLANSGNGGKYFRFPYLHRGDSEQSKAEIEAFLLEQDYRVAPVSIDNQEWMFSRNYNRAKQRGNDSEMEEIGSAYVSYMESIFAFYEEWSVEVQGYEPKQILLLHSNALNAEYLDDLVRMLRERGYEIVSLDEAMTDPIYSIRESYVGSEGLSWIHRVAITRGMPLKREPDETNWLH